MRIVLGTLARDEMRLDCTHTSAEGLALLAANEDIALVFVDMKLPDRKGTQVLRDIKRARPALLVVVMTRAGEGWRRRGLGSQDTGRHGAAEEEARGGVAAST